MQQLGQQLQQATQALETDQAKQQAQVEIARIKEDNARTLEQMRISADLEIARINAQAEIAKEQIKASMAESR